MKIKIDKLKKRIWQNLIQLSKNKNVTLCLYKSYWHYKLFNSKNKNPEQSYFSAIPNQGAGIGHQLANWIAGYWFAKQFGLRFAHIPFSSEKWENLLGLGEDEISVTALIKQGFRKVKIPLFDENNMEEVKLMKNILDSYQGKNVVFIAEQDQFYAEQIGVIDDLKRKFYSAVARKDDKLIYSKDYFNIAIHVRRGDITIGQENQNPNLLLRWQDNDYFNKVLENVLETIVSKKPIAIFLFSQGERKDFADFEKFENIHFCLDMNAQESFLHMVFADLLITSKSSFSYKPALLSNGIKVVPKDFWHQYPNQKDWVKVDNNGIFDCKQLQI